MEVADCYQGLGPFITLSASSRIASALSRSPSGRLKTYGVLGASPLAARITASKAGLG